MHERLTAVFRELGVDWEIIFVDSGSPDDTPEVLAELAARDRRVTVVRHTRAFGSQSAYSSGMRLATGDAVILLDGDLQDPPEMIPEFFARWQEGYEVVYGERVKREGPTLMNAGRKAFYRVFQRLAYVSMPVDAGDFSLLDRRAVDAINALPETHRFVRGLRAYVGFRQIGIPYERPERLFGRSSNNFLHNMGWARRAIISFSYAPLDLIGWLAFFTTAIAVVAGVVEIVLQDRRSQRRAEGLRDADRRRPLHRRRADDLLQRNRLLPRPHVRGDQGATALPDRPRAQPAPRPAAVRTGFARAGPCRGAGCRRRVPAGALLA